MLAAAGTPLLAFSVSCALVQTQALRAPSLITGGDFANGGPDIVAGRGWDVSTISGCPCTSTHGISLAATPEGAYAEMLFPLVRPTGVVTLEFLGWFSEYYEGNPTVATISALAATGEVISTATEVRPSVVALGKWHLYTVRLAVSANFSALRVRLGAGIGGGSSWLTAAMYGVATDNPSGLLNVTDLWIGFENAVTLPVISRGRPVSGPVGVGSKSPNLMTDGSRQAPPYGSVPWEVMALDGRPISLTLKFDHDSYVCGVRLVQTQEKIATYWSLHTSSLDTMEAPDINSTSWQTVLQAVPQQTFDSIISETVTHPAVSGQQCTGVSATRPFGSADCVRAVATSFESQMLFPCTSARWIRLDLEQSSDCCFMLIEWEILSTQRSRTCEPPCRNGGRCSGDGTCECPAVHSNDRPRGWEGPTCVIPNCAPECQNQGLCIGPHECQCQPGYSGEACTVERCGDGYRTNNEQCDDGNDASEDGCAGCVLEDQRLDPSQNESLYNQYKRLYPDVPPPLAPPKGPPAFEEIDDSFAEIVTWTVCILSLTHVILCCVCGTRSTLPLQQRYMGRHGVY